jgi:hypothetical protein
MRSTSTYHTQPSRKLIVVAYGLVPIIALVVAAVWPEVRAPALAFSIAAAAQLPVWMSLPASLSGMAPRTLVALEGGLAVASVFASVFASAWFVLPAVTTLMTTIGLVWARRVGPTASPQQAATEAPAEAPPPATMTAEDVRALHPGLDRFGTAFMTFFLFLASLCALRAFADPGALVGVAVCAGLAGMPRLGDWLLAKTMPPSHRRALERRRRQR